MKYYIVRNGQPDGPFEPEELLARGLNGNSLVWRQGLPEWVKACELPELAGVLNGESQIPPAFDEAEYNNRLGMINQWNQPQADNKTGYQFGNGSPYEPIRPNNFLAEAIVATILCFLPTGIISIINAAKVNELYDRGDFDGAYSRSKSARNWLIATIILGIVVDIALLF